VIFGLWCCVMNTIQHLRLRERRQKRGGTLANWASRLGVSTGQLSRLERGLVGRVDFEVLEQVKRLYGISDEEVRQAIFLAES